VYQYCNFVFNLKKTNLTLRYLLLRIFSFWFTWSLTLWLSLSLWFTDLVLLLYLVLLLLLVLY